MPLAERTFTHIGTTHGGDDRKQEREPDQTSGRSNKPKENDHAPSSPSLGSCGVIDPEELDKLRTPADKTVNIDAFVPTDAIDPIYLSGKVYYLVPDGKPGEHPFGVLREGMVQENRYPVAKAVLFGKEQVVLLRPTGKLLAMFALDYDFQVKKPAEFEDMLPEADVDPKSLR